MSEPHARRTVAVLLATYNSTRFIAEQVASLARNRTPFTLHWVDDGSSDSTVQSVEAEARRHAIALHRHHAAHRLGVPEAFFHLLANVEADVYLFCDHDDIWEDGKIDYTVEAMDARVPMFCFSEPKLFTSGSSEAPKPFFEVLGVSAAEALDIRRALLFNPAVGNTVAVNRPLRELYRQHAHTLRRGAAMHDWWLYLLARAAGEVRLLEGCPTTLYRQHAANTLGVRMPGTRRGVEDAWQRHKRYRLTVARQAQAFLQVAATLERNPMLDALVRSANLVSQVAQRQNLALITRLLRLRCTPIGALRSAFFLGGCLLSDAQARGEPGTPASVS